MTSVNGAPSLPTNAYAAFGLRHPFIHVDPATNLVIVKINHTAEPVLRDEENVDFFRAVAAQLAE